MNAIYTPPPPPHLPDGPTLLFILADKFVTEFPYEVFSISATNRRDDGFASAIVENCPKLLTARNPETKNIHVLHDLPDFSNALIKPALVHYQNMPMLYTAVFHGCKKDIFQMKIGIFF